MLKFLLFFLALLFSFEADAVVKQHISEALSYENVLESAASVDESITYTPPVVKKNKPAKEQTHEVNLKNKPSAVVFLKAGDFIKIKLNENNGYSWKTYLSSENLMLTSNLLKNSEREFVYKITYNNSEAISFIYFDYIDPNNKITTTKVLTIKLQN